MIGVIGIGSFGTSLATVLAKNTKDPVYVWDNNEELLNVIAKTNINSFYLPGFNLPKNITPVKTLTELIEKVNDILIVVPSKFFKDVLIKIIPNLKNHRIAYATKGLEFETGKLLHEIIIDTLGSEQTLAVISGPSFATEIMKNIPTAVSIASNNKNFSLDLETYFQSKYFKVYSTDDIVGLQLGGVLKNIIALACGISDGVGFGSNTKAAIITKGLDELLLLGKTLGAKPETLLGLSGCGDIILTATDDQSRNRRMGIAIGQGKTIEEAAKEIGQAVESLNNCVALCKLAKRNNVELKFTNKIETILRTKKITQDSIIDLI